MAIFRIHVVNSPEPIQPGGSLIALCGKPIVKSYLTGMIDTEALCPKCKLALWEGRYITPVCEADELPELMRDDASV